MLNADRSHSHPVSYPVVVPKAPSKTELDEFLGRAMVDVIVREEFAALLRSGGRRLRIKQGFDPTKPNLHIGHAVGLRKLRTLANWGHGIGLIVGGWTTQIGDPTDQDETRPTMSHEQVLKNAEAYVKQVLTGAVHGGRDGEKMSKSKPKSGISRTDQPSEIYGKVMSIDDALMPQYFEWATDLPWDEVKQINAAIANGEIAKKAAKEKLAWQITSELHSPAKAAIAAAAFTRQFSEGQLPEDIEEVTLEADGAKEIGIVELLMKGLKKSRSESRRLVEQGGVSVDGSKTNESSKFPTSGTYIVKYGKRSYAKFTWR